MWWANVKSCSVFVVGCLLFTGDGGVKKAADQAEGVPAAWILIGDHFLQFMLHTGMHFHSLISTWYIAPSPPKQTLLIMNSIITSQNSAFLKLRKQEQALPISTTNFKCSCGGEEGVGFKRDLEERLIRGNLTCFPTGCHKLIVAGPGNRRHAFHVAASKI